MYKDKIWGEKIFWLYNVPAIIGIYELQTS